MTEPDPVRLGILLSGAGRTLQNIHDHISEGKLRARIECVISSNPNAYGIERARKLNLPVQVVARSQMADPDFHHKVTQHLTDANVELVCMAGFCTLWHIPPKFEGRVINIHPALLPDFGGKGYYGMRVHAAVIAAGRRKSGCTVHFCDNLYDHGPTLVQRTVPVLEGDTPEALAARVFEQECIAYPEAITLIGEGRVRLSDGTVSIIPTRQPC